MKKIILGLLTLTVFAGYSQAITVNSSTYDTSQLVNDVFFNSSLPINATNIVTKTGTNYGSVNGIGYFQNTNPNFPFEDGIILSTGNISNSTGPKTLPSYSGDGNSSWIGDVDMNNFLGSSNFVNASSIEFDFIANSSQINFDFLFASEEYGQYQCNLSDGIVFLLKDMVTGVTTNIAVVPQTSTSIGVSTIRDNLYNNSCSSVNSQYFDKFNGGTNAATSPVNFFGTTKAMNASSVVIQGRQYKLKIVVADRFDFQYDSAIFLKAGSFSNNIQTSVLGPDLTIENNTAVCQGNLTTLSTGLSLSNYVFVWKKDGLVLGTTSSLVIAQPGTYEVEYTNMVTNLTSSDSIIVEYNVAPTLAIINPPPFCSPDTIDITSPDFIFEIDAEGTKTYWADAACTILLANPTSIAQSGTYYVKSSNSCGFDVEPIVVSIVETPFLEPIANVTSCDNYFLPMLPIGNYYTAPNGVGLQIPAGAIITESQNIYVYALYGSCSSETSFMVTIYQTPIVSQPQNLIINEENTDGFATFNLTSQIPAILNGQSPNDYQVSFFETQNDAYNNINPIANPSSYTNSSNFQVIYFRISSLNSFCYATSSFMLEVVNIPVIITFQDFIVYETSTDGISTFDLTSQIPNIIGVNSNPDDYVVAFFTSYDDAINNVNQIVNPTNFVNTSNPQTIYVGVTNLGGKLTSTSVIGSMILSVQETLSVSDIDLKTIKISPNPIIDFMTVSANENINSIAIFNTLGQLVFEKKVNTSEEKIDLTALTSGNYIVKIISETSSKLLKIIKQ